MSHFFHEFRCFIDKKFSGRVGFELFFKKSGRVGFKTRRVSSGRVWKSIVSDRVGSGSKLALPAHLYRAYASLILVNYSKVIKCRGSCKEADSKKWQCDTIMGLKSHWIFFRIFEWRVCDINIYVYWAQSPLDELPFTHRRCQGGQGTSPPPKWEKIIVEKWCYFWRLDF